MFFTLLFISVQFCNIEVLSFNYRSYTRSVAALLADFVGQLTELPQ